MVKSFRINKTRVGENQNVFLIAEAGVNHNGDFSIAKKLIDVAVKAGVDAIKFQTFVTENLLLSTTPKAEYQKKATTNMDTSYEMLEKYEFTKDDFKNLKNYCEEKKIIFLSTPFDKESVDWLDELNVAAFKIGSGDLNNFPLIKYICSKRKPMLLSTGMATLNEVIESVGFIKSNKIKEIVIFQCTTSYPAPYQELNLNVIDTYKRQFPEIILGFSDHSLGIEASIGATTKGVKLIEKHFTLDKNMEGPDHKASLEPYELTKWVSSIRNIEKALGNYEKIPSKSEFEIAKVARKSIVTLKDIKKEEILTLENITTKRPGIGIPPTKFEDILGKKLNKNLPKNSLINWEDID